MVKLFFVSVFLFICLDARENPFFSKEREQDLSITSNQVTQLEPLKRATVLLPNTARIIQKVAISYKNLDGSVEEKSIDLENSIDWHLPIFVSQNYLEDYKEKTATPKKSKPFVKYGSLENISFYSKEKSLKIVTKDKMIRNFLLVEPHRIVLDFKRDADFRSYSFTKKQSIFKSIKIGNHDGYYRVVIELDGVYQYSLATKENTIYLNLK